jgi:hypothetical protein
MHSAGAAANLRVSVTSGLLARRRLRVRDLALFATGRSFGDRGSLGTAGGLDSFRRCDA